MKFEMWKDEKTFVESFLRRFRNTQKSLFFMRDFRTGYGLPDIVAINYDERILSRRKHDLKSVKTPAFTIDCAYTLSYLSRRRGVSYETLKANFSNYNGSLNSILNTLEQRNLIQVNNGKIKALRKSHSFAIKTITTIEAKLRQWSRVIHQAQRHLWFTECSYVLLPKQSPLILSHIRKRCQTHEVGLFLYDSDLRIKTLVKKPKARPHNTHIAWLLNEILIDRV